MRIVAHAERAVISPGRPTLLASVAAGVAGATVDRQYARREKRTQVAAVA
ncbi:hypothetical protein [Haloarchaeobius sp. FL176]|nr:hypothetical protein [Haloarchaeobius sp. FL176]